MASKSYSDSALNEYFEAMSFQDEEERTWHEYTNFLVSCLDKIASSFRSQPIPIDIRAFGSSVEKLRIISPENIGDIDVMVFSLADELTINESIMEYSIPGKPVYVRLRGKDHPVLQHCLAENSDYVASETLKTFHPRVFGDSAGFFNVLPKVFQKMQDVSSYGVACAVRQSTSCPSIQWNFSQTRESLLDQVTGMKDYSDFKANDEIRGFLDWMAIALNSGKPFTEDHSAIMDEASNYLEETVQKLGKDLRIENFGNSWEEMSMAPKLQELRNKFHGLEKPAKELTETQEVDKQGTEVKEKEKNPGIGELEVCGSHVEPKGTDVNKETEKEKYPEIGKLEVCGSQVEPKGTNVNKETGKEQNTGTEELEVCGSQVEPENVISTYGTECNAQGKPQEIGATENASSLPGPTREGGEIDLSKMTKENIVKYCIENFLRVGDSSKSQEEIQNEYLKIAEDQTRQKGGFDIVPGFLARGWPIVARDWISRDRLWPNQNVISSILDYGFHLVAKSPNESERPDLDFRLSFSHAELVLSKELNDIQRQCYRCFKSYHLTIIRNREPKIFASYFLKTILFWAIEETETEFWRSENRGCCCMMLLRKLLKALETKFLPHFFIPEFNLLKDVAKEFPEEMQYLAEEVRKVCEDPMNYPNVLPEEDQGAKLLKTLEPVPDPSAEEVGSCGITASSGRQKDANLPPQKDISTKNPFSSAPMSTYHSGNTTPAPFFPRFQDFQVLYRQVYQELLDLALSDEAVDDKDPTIKSIVTNMRKVVKKMEDEEGDTKKGMEKVLEHCIENKYSTYVCHLGPTPRDRMLSLLKGEWEAFAYMVRQDDLAPGNEHIIANRMLTSARDGNSDSFDLSVMYPGGSNVITNIFEVLAAQFDPKKQSEGIDDDIPLD